MPITAKAWQRASKPAGGMKEGSDIEGIQKVAGGGKSVYVGWLLLQQLFCPAF